MCQRREGKLILNLLAFRGEATFRCCIPQQLDTHRAGLHIDLLLRLVWRMRTRQACCRFKPGLECITTLREEVEWVRFNQMSCHNVPEVECQHAKWLTSKPKRPQKTRCRRSFSCWQQAPWPQRTREGFGTWRHVGTQKSCETSHSPH